MIFTTASWSYKTPVNFGVSHTQFCLQVESNSVRPGSWPYTTPSVGELCMICYPVYVISYYTIARMYFEVYFCRKYGWIWFLLLQLVVNCLEFCYHTMTRHREIWFMTIYIYLFASDNHDKWTREMCLLSDFEIQALESQESHDSGCVIYHCTLS